MKKLLFVLLALVMSITLVACGGQEGEDNSNESGNAEIIEIAAKQETKFTVVNYLPDEAAVKKLVARLVPKIGTNIPMDDKADGPAIYVGYGEDFPKLEMPESYTNFRICAADGNIYIMVNSDFAIDAAFNAFKSAITRISENTYGIEGSIDMNGDAADIGELIPVFETMSGSYDTVYDCGYGDYEVIYTGMDASAKEEISAYEETLKSLGFELYQSNEIGDNYFITYSKDDTQIHCNYFASRNELRVIYGEKHYQPDVAPITEYEKQVTPSLSIIGMSDSVECLVLQLADGQFVVVDGGWGTSEVYDKTLNPGESSEKTVQINRNSDADQEALYNFLTEKTPEGTKPKITWMITHGDPDHITLPNVFLGKHRNDIEVVTAIYNFPDVDAIGVVNGGDPASFTGYMDGFIDAVNKNFPDANHYVYHTGEKYQLPGLEIEFLFTSEDLFPQMASWMNGTSGVWRFTIEGRTILIPGDAEAKPCDQMVGVFGDYLKSDVLQLNHHGCNGATLGFYEKIDPEICFWCCQQYHYDLDTRHNGTKKGYEFNKFIRESANVKANYCNSETATILLPSFEEEK